MVIAQNVTNCRSNVGLSTSIYTDYHHIAYFLIQVSNAWLSNKPVKIDQCEGVPDPGILEHRNNLLLSLPLFILSLLSSCTSLLFFFCLLFFVLIIFGFCFDKWSEVHCYKLHFFCPTVSQWILGKMPAEFWWCWNGASLSSLGKGLWNVSLLNSY